MLAPILLLQAFFTLSTGCTQGWFGHGFSCYNLVRVSASWAEAMAYCNAIGSNLARVETAEEQTFLQAVMTNESSTIDSGVWIAGLDYLVEGDWQWAPEGGAIKNFFWGPNDPNNLHSGHRGQNCLMLYKSAGFKWDDHYCSASEFFLCEREATNP